MQVVEAKIEEDQFADPDENGVRPEKLVVVWEAELDEDQLEAGATEGTRIYQRFNPYYGETKRGPSKFKQFVDGLMDQDLIPPVFNCEQLVGIKQRCVVEKYTKTMGTNKGQPGNRITSVLPLKKARGQQTPKLDGVKQPPARPARKTAEESKAEAERASLIAFINNSLTYGEELGIDFGIDRANLAKMDMPTLEELSKAIDAKVDATQPKELPL
jgi:hypothetical protein